MHPVIAIPLGLGAVAFIALVLSIGDEYECTCVTEPRPDNAVTPDRRAELLAELEITTPSPLAVRIAKLEQERADLIRNGRFLANKAKLAQGAGNSNLRATAVGFLVYLGSLDT